MDIATIASEATQYLAPLAPFLLQAGEKAAEEGGKRLAGAAWESAKALWGRLWGRVEEKPAAAEAARDLAAEPEDADTQAAFRVQLKKILAADEELATEVARWLKAEAPAVSYHGEVHGSGALAQGPGAVAAGEGGVAVGGNVGGDVRVGRGWTKKEPE